jgi:hypothetical protein
MSVSRSGAVAGLTLLAAFGCASAAPKPSPAAPFSWEPEQVEVLPSGTLAPSTGPVRDPAGKLTGTFTSIWRREGPGRWRILFDMGCPACPSVR